MNSAESNVVDRSVDPLADSESLADSGPSERSTTMPTCRVVYLRVTPDELAELKRLAILRSLSLQRYARITLGLKDRGGQRNRKEQTHGRETQAASIEKGDSESPLRPSEHERVPMSEVP
jgi:hypothetical protein